MGKRVLLSEAPRLPLKDCTMRRTARASFARMPTGATATGAVRRAEQPGGSQASKIETADAGDRWRSDCPEREARATAKRCARLSITRSKAFGSRVVFAEHLLAEPTSVRLGRTVLSSGRVKTSACGTIETTPGRSGHDLRNLWQLAHILKLSGRKTGAIRAQSWNVSPRFAFGVFAIGCIECDVAVRSSHCRQNRSAARCVIR